MKFVNKIKSMEKETKRKIINWGALLLIAAVCHMLNEKEIMSLHVSIALQIFLVVVWFFLYDKNHISKD